MPAAHALAFVASAAPLAFPGPCPFEAFLARHDLPRAEALPPRASALARAAYEAAPRYVGHSEPARTMIRAHVECREFRMGLLDLARAIVACDAARAAS